MEGCVAEAVGVVVDSQGVWVFVGEEVGYVKGGGSGDNHTEWFLDCLGVMLVSDSGCLSGMCGDSDAG